MGPTMGVRRLRLALLTSPTGASLAVAVPRHVRGPDCRSRAGLANPLPRRLRVAAGSRCERGADAGACLAFAGIKR